MLVGGTVENIKENIKENAKTQKRAIVHTAIVVEDYDEAIKFYTEKLNFTLIKDEYQEEQNKRWVIVSPDSTGETSLLLARASNDEQKKFIGNQTGGRVFIFVSTMDFWGDYNSMLEKGVEFVREPKEQDYGIVAVFKDLYGNLFDLVEFNN